MDVTDGFAGMKSLCALKFRPHSLGSLRQLSTMRMPVIAKLWSVIRTLKF